MTVTRVSAVVSQRVFDRLEYWHLNGPYLGHVRSIGLGVLPQTIPADMLSLPVRIQVAAYPVGASGAAAAGVATSTTEYDGMCELAVVGQNLNANSGYIDLLDTLDDVIKIVCDIEQKTAWTRFTVPTVDGDNFLLQANARLEVEWPTLRDANGALYHFAVVRWGWKAYVTWD